MSAPAIDVPALIHAAHRDPAGVWKELVGTTREAIANDHFGAAALAYTVLGIGMRHALITSAERDIVAVILAKQNRSKPLLLGVGKYAEAAGDHDLLARTRAALGDQI